MAILIHFEPFWAWYTKRAWNSIVMKDDEPLFFHIHIKSYIYIYDNRNFQTYTICMTYFYAGGLSDQNVLFEPFWAWCTKKHEAEPYSKITTLSSFMYILNHIYTYIGIYDKRNYQIYIIFMNFLHWVAKWPKWPFWAFLSLVHQ